MASSQNIGIIKDILKSRESEGSFVVVVSALGGVTNNLIELGNKAINGEDFSATLEELENRHVKMCEELIPVKNRGTVIAEVKMLFNQLEDICKGIFWVKELSSKTMDYLLSFGESLSSRIISHYLVSENLDASLVDPSTFLRTDSNYGNANVDFKQTAELISKEFSNASSISLVPGFIAHDNDGNITTLGRGGSDYTASILAAALDAEVLEIWTDVDGLMTADPRYVRSAHPISVISYEDAMELSHFGAKVIYPPTIHPVLDKKIPIIIKNTMNPDGDGTTIINVEKTDNESVVKGLSSIQNVALINLKGSGMVGIPNISHRLFRSLSTEKVNIILITQASSEHSICIGIDQNEVISASKAIADEFEYEFKDHKLDPMEIEENLAVVALVGSKMRHQSGVSGRLFSTLGNNGVNIKAIAQGSSERNISVVIDSFQVKKALNSLHESFFLSETKRVNLFIVGAGNVGAAFINQIKEQEDFLRDSQHLNLKVVGIANSRNMIIDSEGINLSNWETDLKESTTKYHIDNFKEKIYELNLRNSLFIDNTASDEIPKHYLELINHSISVITPNKIACSSDYQTYADLKKAAVRKNQKFLFETNVGAGLPIISTLNDLVKSGDRIQRIEAVLSGSLNFIFNNFQEGKSFKSIVEQAMSEGYTEPDPRIDLSGIDVKRKILILIRESGMEMELDDIITEGFIPEEIMSSDSVDKFLSSLEKNEGVFSQLLTKASEKSSRIKYVASFNEGKASTGLKYVTKDHPFYDLQGKDNIVLFYTTRYPEQPLVVKGAGAGAEVTASGIFADVMRFSNK